MELKLGCARCEFRETFTALKKALASDLRRRFERRLDTLRFFLRFLELFKLLLALLFLRLEDLDCLALPLASPQALLDSQRSPRGSRSSATLSPSSLRKLTRSM